MVDTHRILVVEDNHNLNDILVKIVRSEGYETSSVFNGRDAISALKDDGPFDLVLLDIMLPDPEAGSSEGLDGLEVCRIIKEDTELSDTLIFLVTVKDQPEDIMRGIDAGADDYITKPFNTTLLLAKIKAMLRIRKLSSELKDKNRLLKEMAITDGLTGIPNYRFFMDKLEEEVKRHRRYSTPYTLLLMDLDNFKEINDTLGHRHGDFVLKAVGDRLSKGLRNTDFLARYGGDEFALLLTQTDNEGGHSVAQQILARFEEPVTAQDKEHIIRLSIGMVASHGEEPLTADEMIIAADRALYRAKESGGHVIRTATDRFD
jgi:diguanylate cyclase (GGDEF)-like protein